MHLTFDEKEKLLLHMAGILAINRLKRGLKLNYPESIALITYYVMEGARDGKMIKDIIYEAKNILYDDQVMDGIYELIKDIKVEATFPDGTKLVTIHHPIKKRNLKKINTKIIPIPGEYNLLKDDITLLPNRHRITRIVSNKGNRPIQIGSHFHFYDTNSMLSFDRQGTKGYRLDIAAGRSIRFEPGEMKKISLVQMGGNKKIIGFLK
ncbi:urease subunit gamma [Blattabacterium cuenoti]|uniref:urease subunit gamma n=1 Tax=Blattabacterium cuenoti TaxID=1653831 RepID=UPI00163C549E|nr:urease subunit gamma [Blattabacterium cuenoti]